MMRWLHLLVDFLGWLSLTVGLLGIALIVGSYVWFTIEDRQFRRAAIDGVIEESRTA